MRPRWFRPALLSIGSALVAQICACAPSRTTDARLSPAAVSTIGADGHVAVAASLVPPALSVRGAALRDSVDAYLRQQVARGFSGAVLVERAGEIVLHEGYGPPGSGITRGTAFWIGSVTKPFTATGIMLLVEAGRLSVGDSLGGLLDHVPPDKRGITVHQLLTHTSGIGTGSVADGITDRSAALRAILAKRLVAPPGSRYEYSNEAYSLLAALLEIRSGMSYEQFVRERLFAPAQMRESGLWGAPPAPGDPSLASVRRPRRGAVAQANWGYRGSTGLRSTVADLYRWHVALRDSVVISGATQRLMYQPHARPSETRAYGYGWQLLLTPGQRVITHPGAEDGLDHYAALRRGVDRPHVVSLLSNAPEALTMDVLRGVLRLVQAP
jgi:CubicO group peptidase (beta-lactamase class C family)